MNFIAYIRFYIKITLLDGSVAYSYYNMDISNELTNESINNFLEITKKYYKENGYSIASAEYVTEEEYSSNVNTNTSVFDEYKWSDYNE